MNSSSSEAAFRFLLVTALELDLVFRRDVSVGLFEDFFLLQCGCLSTTDDVDASPGRAAPFCWLWGILFGDAFRDFREFFPASFTFFPYSPISECILFKLQAYNDIC